MRLLVWIALAASGCATAHLVEKDPVVVEAAAPEPDQPKPKHKRVEVKEDRIDVSETIQFEFSSSRIAAESHEVLDELADAITSHPEIRKLRVEGHTDNSGDAPHNLRLSKKRAAAVVKYLVGKGVDANRLVAAGFGQTKPIAKNDTEEGRAQNRRVAFTILDRGGNAKTVDKAPSDDDTSTDDSSGDE
jgi:outer membrane protein OmpA-like peptidoglycan-associated protein